MNFDVIGSNLAEATEELVRLQAKAANGSLSEEDFQIRLLHAYHYLNFAWNIRHRTNAEYRSLTQEQFETLGKYPVEIEEL